jgi:hypothetical protein
MTWLRRVVQQMGTLPGRVYNVSHSLFAGPACKMQQLDGGCSFGDQKRRKRADLQLLLTSMTHREHSKAWLNWPKLEQSYLFLLRM